MLDLENDDLGEWGESRFKALCAASGLVANKAERDKMGWDFIVQSPPVSEAGVSLDQRPGGLNCRIQIKSQWIKTGVTTPVTLSAAERLAKDSGPAFIAKTAFQPKGQRPLSAPNPKAAHDPLRTLVSVRE